MSVFLHRGHRRVVSAALCLAMPAGAEDLATGMCLARGLPESLCVCASEKLKQGSGDENYALCEQVGERFQTAIAEGAATADTWDTTVREVAEKRGSSYIDTLKKRIRSAGYINKRCGPVNRPSHRSENGDHQ